MGGRYAVLRRCCGSFGVPGWSTDLGLPVGAFERTRGTAGGGVPKGVTGRASRVGFMSLVSGW